MRTRKQKDSLQVQKSSPPTACTQYMERYLSENCEVFSTPEILPLRPSLQTTRRSFVIFSLAYFAIGCRAFRDAIVPARAHPSVHLHVLQRFTAAPRHRHFRPVRRPVRAAR